MASVENEAGAVVARLEGILESVVDCLAEKQEMTIDLVPSRGANRRRGNARLQHVRYPGKTEQEAKKFCTYSCLASLVGEGVLTPICGVARLLVILQYSHDALVSGAVLTKRFVPAFAPFALTCANGTQPYILPEPGNI